MDRKIKCLWVGDGVTPTGFSTVNHNIIKYLPKDKYEIHHLAVNYFGDPHGCDWLIYPAAIKGDPLGFNRIGDFVDKDIDMIFILNDIWVIARYLELIKKAFTKVPFIVVYFPVDSMDFDTEWFKDSDIVSKVVTYTEFGKSVVLASRPDLDVTIMPHGVDTEAFYPMLADKKDIKARLYPDRPDFLDSFVVLSAQRNQPRKRLDVTLIGFALFAENKPENVKYYHHAGLRDVGVDIVKLAKRFNVDNRLIITNRSVGIQTVSTNRLNLIYNATEVGINTSLGEGWSLTNHEHASIGRPQVVSDHSALHELYQDAGILVPARIPLINMDTTTTSYYTMPEDVATALNEIYYNKALYDELAIKSREKFAGEKYQWCNISRDWDKLFDELWS